MTPKEQFSVQGKRLASWLNRNGMNDLVNTARKIATQENATHAPENHKSEGEVLLLSLIEGVTLAKQAAELSQRMSAVLDRLEQQPNLGQTEDRIDFPHLRHGEDDDSPFDL